MAAACLVLVALGAAPAGPAGAADWNGQFSIWRNSAFATQYLDASCVGATIQMTLNLVNGARDHSKGHQLNYLPTPRPTRSIRSPMAAPIHRAGPMP